MAEFGRIIGIDLGTTNSVVAVVENDQPVVLVNSEGSTRTPSVVSFPEAGAPPIVGELAKRQALLCPERTVMSIKRLMGRTYRDVVELGFDLPYQLAEQEGRLLVRIGNQGYTPSQISALILQKLKKTAEDYFGEPVDKAVITVPAYFDDLQRQATQEAAELAGLQVVRLINEPTAAAIAYGLGRGGEERVAVYDFGGGTFDLTILDIAGNTFEVLTSVGDTHLGGDDIDALLVERLVGQLRELLGETYEPDALVLQRLREAAEKAKCELSIARQATVTLPFIAIRQSEPVHLEATIRRSELEQAIRPLVDRTLDCCRRALEACRLQVTDIDRVVLVGGSTRIPLVQQAVEDFFGIPPYKGINPDEIVAMGAAMQGAIMQGQLKEVVLLDVTPHSLGVEVEGGKVSRVIERNSTIPIKAAKLFTTTEDNQEVVVVHVVQGEGERVSECRSLGKFVLTGIQQAKAGIPRIQVTFHVNADGMVEVSAQDMATREEKGITVAVAPGEQELPDRAKRRGRGARREPSGEGDEVVVGPAPTQTTEMRRKIHVAHEAPPGFVPLGATKERALSPRQLAPMPLPQGEAPAGASDRAGSATFSEREEKTQADVLRLPDPVTLPCSPQTRALLGQLRTEAPWRPVQSSAQLARGVEELEVVATSAANKPGVWPWLVYGLGVTGRVDEARRRLLEWASGSSPDRDEAWAMAELFDQQFGSHPLHAAARARIACRQGRWNEAFAELRPWMEDPKPAPEVAAVFVEAARHKLETTRDEALELALAKALVATERYDEAIPILEHLASASGGVRDDATKFLGMCYAKKGMLHLAWQKLQSLPRGEDTKDVLYELASEAERAHQPNLAREIFTSLASATHPFRDAPQRAAAFEELLQVERPDAGPRAGSHELAMVAAAFADSRFVILDEINRGSMGVIYRARDKVLDEIVALKVLNDYLAVDPVALERFKREARAAKRLAHPNIVRIHDMYEIGPKRLLSMEYIAGQDLKTLLRQRGPLPCHEVVRLAKAVCEALAYAHKLQIVHRDIKPANIMIAEDGRVKVTDFGIAKFVGPAPDVTRSGSQVIGTPLYMSPEQIKGDEVDARSDLYSLGVTLYELLAGTPPFVEGNIEYHHLHTPAPPLPVAVPLELAEAIHRCMAKDPSKRFQSAEELLELLDQVQCPEA